MQTHKETRGCWQREKALGHGGFGEVSLWKNMENGKYIAIKTLQRNKVDSDRVLERWQTEVEILLKLDHNNVVKGFTVPEELRQDDTPSLAMQYCSGGDLRQFISKVEHRCGLPESDVRFIAHDIASAIEYLHSMKIIHRDLKPDNVVLQTCEDVGGDCERTVYKLIDLGYAKDLDQDSIAKSFVGTMCYLAPELLDSDRYTCTVDYWSFGIIMFEMITGLRPFLESEKPLGYLWRESMKNKRPEVIHIFYNTQAQVQQSDRLPTPNQLCRITRGYIEQWLRLMLLLDPKQRGGGFTEKNRRQCFEFLDQLLNVKVIHIFCVPSCQLLSYPLQGPHMQLHEVMTLVERETGIPIARQDLLQSSGIELNHSKPAQQCIVGDLDDTECPVFLFDKACNTEEPRPKRQPEMTEWVRRLTTEPTTLFTVSDQKRAWFQALNFCRMNAKNLKQLQNAQRAALLCLLRNNTTFAKLSKELTTGIVKFRAEVEFFRKSHELDLRKFEEQTKSGIFSHKMHQSWKQAEAEVQELNTLEVETERLEPKCVAVRSMISELQKAQPKQMDSLDKIVEEAMQFVCRNQREKQPITHEGIVAAVNKCLRGHRDLSTSLYTYISKICRCKKELTQLLKEVEAQVQSISQASNRLVMLQSERQRNVWKLVEVALKQTLPSSPLDLPSVNGLPMAQLSLSPPPLQQNREESMTVIHEHRTVKDEFSSIIGILKESSETSLDWSFLDSLVPQLPEKGNT